MRRLLPLSAALLMLLAAPASAQVRPVPGEGDSRIQQVDFRAGQIVQLVGAPGYQLMVELAPDEQVQNVALGDAAAWQVSVSKSGDRLFLKPTQGDMSTNMTVVTSVRVYNFDLLTLSAPAGDTPYSVRFNYPEPVQEASTDPTQYVDVSTAARRMSRYRVSGSRELRPSSITDDGMKTYIAWPRGAAIPAIYALDRLGEEVLVNGMMGPDDVFVIDGAPQRLAFRIDGSVARAERLNPRKTR